MDLDQANPDLGEVKLLKKVFTEPLPLPKAGIIYK